MEIALEAVGTTPSVSRSQKKAEKALCFWCGDVGHVPEECLVVLYLYCEKYSHASQDCPLLSMLKPVAVA
jgi:hypothetical protein